jgi:hypothetical protein
MLTRARERGAEYMVDAVTDELSDEQLQTHEAIGRARLRMNWTQWRSAKDKAQYADKGNQTQISVGVQVALSEAERLKLLERHERAMLANQDKSEETAPTPPEP